MSFPNLRPPPSDEVYVPRVFGFKLHASACTSKESEAPAAGANGPTTNNLQRSAQAKRKDDGEDNYRNNKNAIQRMSPG